MDDITKQVYKIFEKTGEVGMYMLYKALNDTDTNDSENRNNK